MKNTLKISFLACLILSAMSCPAFAQKGLKEVVEMISEDGVQNIINQISYQASLKNLDALMRTLDAQLAKNMFLQLSKLRQADNRVPTGIFDNTAQYFIQEPILSWVQLTQVKLNQQEQSASSPLNAWEVEQIASGKGPLTLDKLTPQQAKQFYLSKLPDFVMRAEVYALDPRVVAGAEAYYLQVISSENAKDFSAWADKVAAVTNMGYFNMKQGAPAMLKMAAENHFYATAMDEIVAKAFINLNCPEQLEQLLSLRSAATDAAGNPKELPATWQNVQWLARAAHFPLKINSPISATQSQKLLSARFQLQESLAQSSAYTGYSLPGGLDAANHFFKLTKAMQEKFNLLQGKPLSNPAILSWLEDQPVLPPTRLSATAVEQTVSEPTQEKARTAKGNKPSGRGRPARSRRLEVNLVKFERTPKVAQLREPAIVRHGRVLLEKQIAFQEQYGRNPVVHSDDPAESKLGNALANYLKKYEQTPLGKSMRANFEKYRVHKTPQMLLAEQEAFQQQHGHNPQVKSEIEEERKLAQALAQQMRVGSDIQVSRQIRENFDKYRLHRSSLPTIQEVHAELGAYIKKHQAYPSVTSGLYRNVRKFLHGKDVEQIRDDAELNALFNLNKQALQARKGKIAWDEIIKSL